jgi:hypothetical protein
MNFSEPLGDFRARLYNDNGQNIEVNFNAANSLWRLVVDKGTSREALRDMVRYLHDQFYLGETEYLNDWLDVVDNAALSERSNTITLKTVDRL